MLETLIETLHFLLPFPFRNQRLGTNHQHCFQFPPCLQFFQNQARFDGFSNADFIGYQHSGAVGLNQFEHRTELVRYKINTRGEK